MDVVKYNKDKQENQECSRLSSDVYFLIQRFLSNGTLRRTLQTLNEELEEHKILPRRIDWEGNEHERSVEDMQQQYPYIRQDFLYYLCNQASRHLNPNNAQTPSYLSFRPKLKNENGIYNNYRQYYNYVARLHGAPIQELKTPFNIVNSIRGREVAGPFSRHRAITPRIYSGIQNQRITLGHLSAVYCLLFDHSGRYIMTGADDLLIKMWSTYTGRLIAVFRGASSEITDIAIDPENTLLGAGSIDRILRVWNLQTGCPVAVLTGHTGMITSVNFCPTPCWGLKYLISTSTDGSIAFWTYHSVGVDKVEFRKNPIMYQEKIRPGQAQMICSSFSPGGTFLATGSADHYVRVYHMKGDEGPTRILEIEAHTDRVDSMQWAHAGLRFLSGSKDGTANIFWFERQQWKSIHLDMATKLPSDKLNSDYDGKKIRVTMVAWDRSDSLVVTAVSDHSLKVWSACNGQLVKVLTGHTDEVYVLEPHPHDEDIILSAGHDGQLFVWDINKGEILAKYLNTIEGQGYGAIFDVKWSPDGCVIAASDSHGNILTFGFGSGSSFYQQLPKELFFHTDYRPLVRDQNHWVLDEQTQVPPHLMPPPFLVDIDGNPYPPMLQRMVPGRENCKVDQLVPNIVIGNEGTQEVIQDVPRRLLEDSEDEDVRGNAGGSHRGQRIRQSTGDWQTDHTIEWKKTVLLPPLSLSILERSNEIRKLSEEAEMREYQKQLRQRPHMISTAGPSSAKNKDKKKRGNKGPRKPKRTSGYSPVTEEDFEKYDMVPLSDESGGNTSFSDWAEEESESKKRRPRRRKIYARPSSTENDDEEEEELTEDTEHSDEDSDVSGGREKTERKSRSSRENNKHSRVKPRRASPKASTSKQSSTLRASAPKSAQVPKKDQVPKVAQTARQPAAVPSTSGTASTSKGPKIKISEQYKLSEWLSETRPRKSPYYPQIGDEIVYFVQGHQLYIAAVQLKNVYEPEVKELPWANTQLQDHEFGKVIGIKYEIQPPRLCCLKVALQDEEGQLKGDTMTIRYHDMPDVLDFLVLKQCYLTALSRDWQTGDRFRCMIDDNWWLGEIADKSAASELFPDSIFMCYHIRWTNGEEERMSPWDMEPIDENRLPEDEKSSIPVLAPELRAVLYKPIPEDWPNCERDTACKAIARGITQVMELAIAEPFLVPVDINVYPTYALIVEYPIDLSTMKARFENNFYRRMAAAQFDIMYLATNAEKFNQKHSVIVRHAKILTELCFRILQSGNNAIDIAAIYHKLVDGYDSSNADGDEDEREEADLSKPSTSRTLRCVPVRSWKSPDDWKIEARGLLELMWQTEDSVAFRDPVNKHKYPTYHQVIKNPMDLGTVKEKIDKNQYQVPQEFCIDMRLIFQNSRTFNTNKRSRIYVMTVRLSAMFEEHIKKILSNWRKSRKRQRRLGSPSEDSDVSVSSGQSSKASVKVDELSNVVDNASQNEEESDSDSDNTPLDVLRAISGSNTGTTESETTLDKISSYYVLEKGNGGKKVEVEYLPEPSTSSQSMIEDFDHNYTNKRITPDRHKPPPNGKKKDDDNYDSDVDEPSTSSAKRRDSDDEDDDEAYNPPTYVSVVQDNNSSDSDVALKSFVSKKKVDKEYKPPSYLKIDKSDTTSEDDDDDCDTPAGFRSKSVDKEYKPPSRRKLQSDSGSESEGVSSKAKGKRPEANSSRKKKKPQSSDDDEDFCPQQDTSSSSRSKKNELPMRRRKNSSELDEDFEINGTSSRRTRKLLARKRKPSFVVEEEDSSSEENSPSSESSDDMPRKKGLRRRPKKNKAYMSSESDSESNLKPRAKRRKVLISENMDSEDDGDASTNGTTSTNGKGGGYFASVSSRGRVRKITERAAAFLKKDKKAG